MLKYFSLLFILSTLSIAKVNFPTKGGVNDQVKFWIKVFTQHNDQQTILHDRFDLASVYHVVDHRGYSNSKRKRKVSQEFRKLKNALRSIVKKKYKRLTAYERKIANQIPASRKYKLRRLLKGLRYQQGMSNRFRRGLERSALYLDYVQKHFKKMNLPLELSFLPHVESSFNYQAYSRFGAAGIWQFMPSSAKLYKLKINRFLDERLDPIASSKAAAWMLKDNYRMLKSWPLAVTAYNHGPASVKRAIRQTGSRDISVIIKKFKHRSFGFASRNFYPSFVAAVTIAKSPAKFLKNIELPDPLRFEQITLKKNTTVKEILFDKEIDIQTFKKFNPFIKKLVYKKSLRIPRGTKIKIPSEGYRVGQDFKKKKEQIKTTDVSTDAKDDTTPRVPSQVPDESKIKIHTVTKGEKIVDISDRYNIPVQALLEFNQIKNPKKIMVGQAIKIPDLDDKETIDMYFQGIKKLPDAEAEKPLAKIFARTALAKALGLNPIQEKDRFYVKIAPYETLGHLSDWSQIPVREILKLNNIENKQNVELGQLIRMPKMNSQKQLDFVANRIEFHQEVETEYLENYELTGTVDLKVKQGETFINVSEHYHSPIWVIMRSQKGSGHQLNSGSMMTIPIINAKPENDVFGEVIQENDSTE